jgi:hypothetical protein
VTEQEENFRRNFRRWVAKILAECEAAISDMNKAMRLRPDLAPEFSPDAWVDIYTHRDWAKAALAAYDASERLPPLPELSG